MQPQPMWPPVQIRKKDIVVDTTFNCPKAAIIYRLRPKTLRKLTSLAFLESLSMDLDHFKCDPPTLKTLDFLREYPLVDLV